MKKISYFLFIGTATIAMACGSGTNDSGDELSDSLGIAPGSPTEINENLGADTNAEKRATATLSGSSGNNVTGTATFTQTGDGTVNLLLQVENLTPGEHAVHLHEKGDCSASDFTSAGGHWNPTGDEHGKRGENGFHSGDISNMTVGEDGIGTINMDVEGWNIGGDEQSDILNKAVIIHADPDDFTSQPSGAAGARVACGVIQAES